MYVCFWGDNWRECSSTWLSFLSSADAPDITTSTLDISPFVLGVIFGFIPILMCIFVALVAAARRQKKRQQNVTDSRSDENQDQDMLDNEITYSAISRFDSRLARSTDSNLAASTHSCLAASTHSNLNSSQHSQLQRSNHFLQAQSSEYVTNKESYVDNPSFNDVVAEMTFSQRRDKSRVKWKQPSIDIVSFEAIELEDRDAPRRPLQSILTGGQGRSPVPSQHRLAASSKHQAQSSNPSSHQGLTVQQPTPRGSRTSIGSRLTRSRHNKSKTNAKID
jgi:MFS superfamily sulfate permease-like transporter